MQRSRERELAVKETCVGGPCAAIASAVQSLRIRRRRASQCSWEGETAGNGSLIGRGVCAWWEEERWQDCATVSTGSVRGPNGRALFLSSHLLVA
jgi:hypothetical protein